MAQIRVLSLDGGGSWALIQVRALIRMYGGNTSGRDVLREFDLVAATSGGSIVLGGLVEDMTLNALQDFFLSEQKRKSIFVGKPHIPDTPKYKTEEKLKGLRAAFPRTGGMRMQDVAAEIVNVRTGRPVHLLITSFDYDRQRGRFFRSATASSPEWGDGDPAEVQMVEAIHASTNAPVLYFDKPAEFPSEPLKRYWDGGVSGCNNPVLAGVTEAVVLGNKPDSITALALGTGSVALPTLPPGVQPSAMYAPVETPGIVHDLKKMAESILDDPPDAASFLAHVMTGGKPLLGAPVNSRVVRMSPLVAPVWDAAGKWKLPDALGASDEERAERFSTLANLPMDAVEQDDVDAIENLATLWLAREMRNQPVRMSREQTAEVGHDWFDDALQAWTMLCQAA